jgi:SAM-dependent methyltransferase
MLLDQQLQENSIFIHGDVLEIGCGKAGRRGRFIPPFAQTNVWRYVDSDIKRKPDICSDLQSLAVRMGAFDTIICLEVFEYLTDPSAAIIELRDSLRPGGVLILSMPFMHRYDCEHDFWRISDYALKYFLEKEGFVEVRIFKQGAALAVIAAILKFVFYAVPFYYLKLILSYLIFLPVTLILSFDRFFAKRIPVLKSFSTGFLIIAKKSTKNG